MFLSKGEDALVLALASYKCGWESCRESFLNVNLKVEKRKPLTTGFQVSKKYYKKNIKQSLDFKIYSLYNGGTR